MFSALTRHRAYLIILLILFCCNPLLFSQDGFLKIDCSEVGLTITVNDSIIGTTPSAIFKLNCGAYELSVANPQKGMWKHDDWLQQIQIYHEDTTVVKPIFQQALTIRSTPFNAQVLLDNQPIGNTPLYFNLPSSKNGILIIKKKFYKPYQVNLLDHNISTINVTLEANSKLAGLFHKIQYPKKTKFQRKKKLIYSLLAFSTCSGFVAAYLKNQAELRYDQYLTAGNLEDMNRYYNDTKRLDKISSISFGIFEVSFVLSFYLLIKTTGY